MSWGEVGLTSGLGSKVATSGEEAGSCQAPGYRSPLKGIVGELTRQRQTMLGAERRGGGTRLLCGGQGEAFEGRRSNGEAASGRRLVMRSA